MEDKRYSMKELTVLYDVDRKTILQWVRELGFPLFSISPKKRYARESELVHWEDTVASVAVNRSATTKRTEC